MSRIVLGQVTARPGDLGSYEYLGSQLIATASALDVNFSQYSPQYTRFRLSYRRVEKPDSVGSPSFLISTNGATFETAAAYADELIAWSATSALTATGTSAATFTAISIASFTLVTATGKAAGECIVELGTTGTGPCRISYDWRYMNSASNPAHGIGSAHYATGPIVALRFQFPAGNFSAVVDVYGIRTPFGV